MSQCSVAVSVNIQKAGVGWGGGEASDIGWGVGEKFILALKVALLLKYFYTFALNEIYPSAESCTIAQKLLQPCSEIQHTVARFCSEKFLPLRSILYCCTNAFTTLPRERFTCSVAQIRFKTLQLVTVSNLYCCRKSFTVVSQSQRETYHGAKTSATAQILYKLFFFSFPSYISGVHHFWVRFLRMWPFFNPTIKVVTFRLRGWCVLGVFFVAGIHPSRTWTSGSFESVWWNRACVHRLDLGLYSHLKEFLGEWSLNPC